MNLFLEMIYYSKNNRKGTRLEREQPFIVVKRRWDKHNPLRERKRNMC